MLLAIAFHADRTTGISFPGTKRIAEICDMDESHVRQVIRLFETKSDYRPFVEVLKIKGKKGRSFRLKYWVNEPGQSSPVEPGQISPVRVKSEPGQISPVETNEPGQIGPLNRAKSARAVEHVSIIRDDERVHVASATALPVKSKEVAENQPELLPPSLLVEPKRRPKSGPRLPSQDEHTIVALFKDRCERVLGVPWDDNIKRKAYSQARRLLSPGRTIHSVRTTFERAVANGYWNKRFTELKVLDYGWVDINAQAIPLQSALTLVHGGKPDADAERRAKEKAYGDARVAERIAKFEAEFAAAQTAEDANRGA